MGLASNQGVSDLFPGEEDLWVLPYSNEIACQTSGSDCTEADEYDVFITPQHGGLASNPLVTPPVRDWTFPSHDVTVPSNHTGAFDYDWDLGGATVHFQPGHRLIVEGEIIVDDMTLTAADPAQGWSGVRAQGATAAATFDGATVSGVRFAPPPLTIEPYPPHAAIEAHGKAQVTLTGFSAVESNIYANGVLATGSGSKVTILGSTRIQFNDGLGALATAGARVLVSDSGTDLRENDYGGVRAQGSGSRIDLRNYAAVDENDRYGAVASFGGDVVATSPLGSGNTSISGNDGGLQAVSNGFVFTGSVACFNTPGMPCTDRPVSVSDNNLGTHDDAFAVGGSVVTAQKTYWNGRTLESQLDLTADGSSSIAVMPLATTLSGFASDGTTVASKNGDENSEMTPAAEARLFARMGESEQAAAILLDALDTARTADDRQALYSAAVSLAAGRMSPALHDRLSVTAERGGDAADWARRGLSMDLAHRGDAQAASGLAVRLTRTEAHAAFGHTMLVGLAVADGDAARALDALGAFANSARETDTDAFGAAVALVAVSFPDADLDRGLRHSDAPHAESKTDDTAPATTLASYPNPSAGSATVALSLAESATATVAVYDALGRRVATLHEGTLAEGDHRFEIGDALAPGLYVITSRTATADGAVSSEAVRWTRTR